MLKPLLALFVLVACADVAAAADEPACSDPYEEAWEAIVLQVVTDEGLVRYDLLAGPLRDDFDAVVEAIETFDASTLDAFSEKLAFWVNAYNVKMVERVLEAGVPENIEEYGFDFFFEAPVRVAGYDVTLNQIEHVILRRQDGPAALEALAVERLDPRIHVRLNCGAVSCPRLLRTSQAHFNMEFDESIRHFVNRPRYLRFEGDTAVLSSLLDWFGTDFETEGQLLGDYLLAYMNEGRPDYERLRRLFEGRSAAEIKAQPNVRFEYDWDLNAAGG